LREVRINLLLVEGGKEEPVPVTEDKKEPVPVEGGKKEPVTC
jgi:hypothetical protein